MLWPIELPAKLTFCLIAFIIGFLTVCAPAWNWERSKTLRVSVLMSCLLFVPSCIGIMELVDRNRFGTFQYAAFSDVNDFRVELFLPSQATNITLRKSPSGHQAKYSISQSDLKDHLDKCWKQFGEHSIVSRDDLHKQTTKVSKDIADSKGVKSGFDLRFDGLGWKEPENLTEMWSPVAADGSGAVYFYDPKTKAAYHSGTYW